MRMKKFEGFLLSGVDSCEKINEFFMSLSPDSSTYSRIIPFLIEYVEHKNHLKRRFLTFSLPTQRFLIEFLNSKRNRFRKDRISQFVKSLEKYLVKDEILLISLSYFKNPNSQYNPQITELSDEIKKIDEKTNCSDSFYRNKFPPPEELMEFEKNYTKEKIGDVEKTEIKNIVESKSLIPQKRKRELIETEVIMELEPPEKKRKLEDHPKIDEIMIKKIRVFVKKLNIEKRAKKKISMFFEFLNDHKEIENLEFLKIMAPMLVDAKSENFLIYLLKEFTSKKGKHFREFLKHVIFQRVTKSKKVLTMRLLQQLKKNCRMFSIDFIEVLMIPILSNKEMTSGQFDMLFSVLTKLVDSIRPKSLIFEKLLEEFMSKTKNFGVLQVKFLKFLVSIKTPFPSNPQFLSSFFVILENIGQHHADDLDFGMVLKQIFENHRNDCLNHKDLFQEILNGHKTYMTKNINLKQ